MNDEAIKAYLRQLGEQERAIRAPISTKTSTVAQRVETLKLMDDICIFMRGFFTAIHLDKDKPHPTKTYIEYYEQARSKTGVKG